MGEGGTGGSEEIALKKMFIRLTAPFREILSPAGLILRAAVLAALFGVCHLLGLRQYAAILCGTSASTTAPMFAAWLGLIYVLMYLAFTVVVPILLIAAGLMSAWNRFAAKKT